MQEELERSNRSGADVLGPLFGLTDDFVSLRNRRGVLYCILLPVGNGGMAKACLIDRAHRPQYLTKMPLAVATSGYNSRVRSESR